MSRTMNPDVKPVGDDTSHRQRLAKLSVLTYSMVYDRFADNPFFSPEATKDTMEGTQFEGENHRRITPYVQALLPEGIMDTLDARVRQNTYQILGAGTVPGTTLRYDVAIIGSGPHGAAVAAHLREKRPDLRTVILEANDTIGGQWRSYGPKPVFQMNSRVRKADRRLPNLPRTAGSINPLGMYAPLELSDIPTGNYPWNTDMGNVCALNGFLSATDILVNCKVNQVLETYDEASDSYAFRQLYFTSAFGTHEMKARFVIDARGLTGRSAIYRPAADPPAGYFTARTFYEHFATHGSPLDVFANVKVAVIGKGDSALTALEALIGNLPASTYGRSGPGRMRPSMVEWFGAPSGYYDDIDGCLRTRYKNGIVQALRRGNNDECGVIVPNNLQVSRLVKGTDRFFDIEDTNNVLSFPSVVVDCTNIAESRQFNDDFQCSYIVGPNNGRGFSDRTTRKIDQLGIAENNVSLWATMEQSDIAATEITKYMPKEG